MVDNIFEQLSKEIPGLQKKVLMAGHTTFNIGGPAEYFLVASAKEEILRAIQAAKKLGVAVFLFGGGSNLLVSDKGIKGLVIKIENSNGITVNGDTMEASAGITMSELVEFSVINSWAGLEWAGGLPGTFGGAIRGNAGAFGGEMKDSVFEVQALDGDLDLKTFSNAQCRFSYRNSLFKEKNWIILSASLAMKKGDSAALRQIADSRINYRKEKHPLEYPSAGSVFKNVAVKDLSLEFQTLFADKVKQDPFPIVPAAWFIIGAGLTGRQAGQAQISNKHSNYIVNLGGAKAQDILDLIAVAKKAVQEKYGITLEVEVQFVGE